MQLNVFIAKSGYCARRKASELIKEGKVKVDGVIIKEPWHNVKHDNVVTVGGKRLAQRRNIYIIMNKPKGVTATLEDRFASKKIVDLIPKRYGRLYPVGRLDKETRGLIILTNDGELCNKVTHPRYEIEKEYIINMKGEVEKEKLKALRSGIVDGEDRLEAKRIEVIRSNKTRTEISIVIDEGKKRHIRRMLERLGMEIIDLKRVRIGNLKLGSLPEGSFREMSKDEIYRLAIDQTIS